VAALGLKLRDLFIESHLYPEVLRDAKRRRALQRQREADAARVEGLKIDASREAERLIQAARGIDITPWSHERLDRALDSLAHAHAILKEEREVGSI
jgi:hypothetical protein